jgi:hypothetical protein
VTVDEPPQIRDLNTLDPLTSGLFLTYLKVLEQTFPQFEIVVVETLRTRERQRWLVAQGKKTSRTIYSNHLLGRAMDVGFLRLSTGEMDWEPKTYQNVYTRVEPRLYGLVSGSQLWNWDSPHLQLLDERLCYPHLVGTAQDVWLT